MSSTTVVPGFAWSYSQLKNYETCPKRYYHYNVVKDVHEPESDQMKEGWRLHKAFELRVKDGTPLPLGMTQHEPFMAKLAKLPGTIYPEQKLALTSSFTPVGYFGKNVWFRSVLDYTQINNHVALTLDYKTGKPSEDMTQMQLAAATLFCSQADIKRVKVGLMFVHHDQLIPAEFVREDLPEIWGEILPRVKLVEKARATQEYPPKPSGLCRKYCAVRSCPHCGR